MNVYLRAAERVVAWGGGPACTALAQSGATDRQIDEFGNLFRPRGNERRGFCMAFWLRRTNEDSTDPKAILRRSIALCLMAAISSPERNR